MPVAQAITLKVKVLVCSPIRSRRLIRRRIKISTTGSQTPLATCEKIRIFNRGALGNRMMPATDHDERGVERIKRGSFLDLVVETGFKAQALADHVGGGKRENRGGEQRCVQEPEREEIGGPRPGDGPQRLRRLPASLILVSP